MGKFQPGISGNPEGKQKGTKSKRTQLAKLLEPHAAELIAKVVELAKEGDIHALRLCIERLIPKPRDNAVPDIDFDSSSLKAMTDSVIHAIYTGNITPIEGLNIFNVIKAKAELIEIVELKDRIEELEKMLKETKGGYANVRCE